MDVGGRAFYKMTGSGNDFVIFDARSQPAAELESTQAIRAMCARGTGVGADGVVFIETSRTADYLMKYFNSDGSKAAMCGNASLCCARLAVDLGIVPPEGFSFEIGSAVLSARVVDGEPEIDLDPVVSVSADSGIDLEPGERRIGFAIVGNPHVVTRCGDTADVDISRRGALLRSHGSLPDGANANFVSTDGDRWSIRTFERGVEGETLACGTGAAATAILLSLWGEARSPVRLRTRSGKVLTVTVKRDGERWLPSLRGEGRLVFRGQLVDV